MANLTPVSSFDNVIQLETSTLVLGGPGAPMNQQAQALLNRSQFLKDEVDALGADVAIFARQFQTVADMTAVGAGGRYDGEQILLRSYYAVPANTGGSKFFWDAASIEAPNGFDIFQVSGVATGRYKRLAEGGVYYMDWAGILADGSDEEAKYQTAIDRTPVGCALIWPLRSGTGTVNMAAGQGAFPRSIEVNKKILLIGNKSFKVRLKNFCDAWQNYTGAVSLSVVQVTSSEAQIRGIWVDANANNHYELDGLGNKHWEEGPTGKRPANGIAVQNKLGQPRIRGVKISECRVDYPLGGIVASGTLSLVGGAPGLDDVSFFNDTLQTDIISDCVFFDNDVYNARGNDYLHVAGVRDSYGFDLRSHNSMYHPVRIYAGCDNCHFYNIQAHVNYAQIESQWNETDLGFWRNNIPGDPDYKIQRSGMAIGSTSASTSANSGNVRRCSIKGSLMSYANNTDGAAIADFTQDTMASFLSWVVTNGIEISGNTSINSPAHGIEGIISTVDPFNNVAQGVVFSRNKVINAARHGMRSIGTGIVYHDNEFINCGTDGSGLSVCYVQGAARVYRNTLVWQRGAANTNNIFEVVAYGPAGQVFISDNVVTGYTGARLLNAGVIVVHGTDGGGVPLAVLNGWAIAQTGAPTIRNDPRVVIDCAGNVSIEGYVAFSAGTTNDQIFSGIGGNVMYRPAQNNYTGCIRVVAGSLSTVHTGRITQAGNMLIDRAAVAAGELFISAQWKTRPVV